MIDWPTDRLLDYRNDEHITCTGFIIIFFAGLTAAQQALDVSVQFGLIREKTGAMQRINLLGELDDLRQRPPELSDGL